MEQKVKYFVDLSIDLANTMAQEKALFCGSMVMAGDSFDEALMESFDDPKENRVYVVEQVGHVVELRGFAASSSMLRPRYCSCSKR